MCFLFVLKEAPNIQIVGIFPLKLTYQSEFCLEISTCSSWEPSRGKPVVALDPPRVQVVASA